MQNVLHVRALCRHYFSDHQMPIKIARRFSACTPFLQPGRRAMPATLPSPPPRCSGDAPPRHADAEAEAKAPLPLPRCSERR